MASHFTRNNKWNDKNRRNYYHVGYRNYPQSLSPRRYNVSNDQGSPRCDNVSYDQGSPRCDNVLYDQGYPTNYNVSYDNASAINYNVSYDNAYPTNYNVSYDNASAINYNVSYHTYPQHYVSHRTNRVYQSDPPIYWNQSSQYNSDHSFPRYYVSHQKNRAHPYQSDPSINWNQSSQYENAPNQLCRFDPSLYSDYTRPQCNQVDPRTVVQINPSHIQPIPFYMDQTIPIRGRGRRATTSPPTNHPLGQYHSQDSKKWYPKHPVPSSPIRDVIKPRQISYRSDVPDDISKMVSDVMCEFDNDHTVPTDTYPDNISRMLSDVMRELDNDHTVIVPTDTYRRKNTNEGERRVKKKKSPIHVLNKGTGPNIIYNRFANRS